MCSTLWLTLVEATHDGLGLSGPLKFIFKMHTGGVIMRLQHQARLCLPGTRAAADVLGPGRPPSPALAVVLSCRESNALEMNIFTLSLPPLLDMHQSTHGLNKNEVGFLFSLVLPLHPTESPSFAWTPIRNAAFLGKMTGKA